MYHNICRCHHVVTPFNHVSSAVDVLYSAGKAVLACGNRAILSQHGRMHRMQLANSWLQP